MPSDHGVRANDYQHGAPASPQPRQPYSEDPITFAKAWAFLLSAQDRQLLSQSEILSGEFHLGAQHPTNEQHKDVNQAHSTASEKRHRRSETIAEVSRASNRKSFVDKAFGINVSDHATPVEKHTSIIAEPAQGTGISSARIRAAIDD